VAGVAALAGKSLLPPLCHAWCCYVVCLFSLCVSAHVLCTYLCLAAAVGDASAVPAELSCTSVSITLLRQLFTLQLSSPDMLFC
jgi:hypothetical protein